MNQYKVAPPPTSRNILPLHPIILPLHPSGKELLAWASQHRTKSPEEIQKLLQPFVMNSPDYKGVIDYYNNVEADEQWYYEKYENLKAKYDGLVAHHGIVHGG